jgi:hypothetical protein
VPRARASLEAHFGGHSRPELEGQSSGEPQKWIGFAQSPRNIRKQRGRESKEGPSAGAGDRPRETRRGPLLAARAQSYPAIAAGGNVAAGPRIGLHDLARGEGALLLDDDNATLNLTRT